jgi:hypothetical protein
VDGRFCRRWRIDHRNLERNALDALSQLSLKTGKDLDPAAGGRLAELSGAMRDPNRIRILFTLVLGEANVGAIADPVGVSRR